MFDIKQLRLPNDYATQPLVEKVMVSMAVGKPNRQEFFRSHPDPLFSTEVASIAVKGDREAIYIVDPALLSQLPMGEWKPIRLQLSITRGGNLFLWALRVPGPEGKEDRWMLSALEAREMSEKHWIRIQANQQAGAYDVHRALADLGEPAWPADITLGKAVELAFRGRVIDTLEHPVLRQLRGEV